MNNNNELIGIRVISTSPNAHEHDISVSNQIEITFSADLNRETLNNSIMVFEDFKGVYNGVPSLRQTSDYRIIPGVVSYKERVMTFKPKEKLNTDTRYIVVVNGNVKDIVGNKMMKNFVFTFHTELAQSYGPCEIISPSYGEIFSHAPIVSWKNQFSDSYIIQVSKQNTFEVLLFETFFVDSEGIDTISYDLNSNLDFKEGVYYLRVKSEGGPWSVPVQFFYKEVTDAIVAYEDQSEDIYLKDFLDGLENELEILEIFPSDGSINNSIKTNIWYMKVKGHMLETDLDLLDCEVCGEPFDEEDDIADEHGQVQGSYTVIYDSEFDYSYLVFTPDPLGETEDPIVLEIINGEQVEVQQ